MRLARIAGKEAGVTKDEAIKKLKEEQHNEDKEMAHIKADTIICELLTSLGMKDVVKECDKVDRWYA